MRDSQQSGQLLALGEQSCLDLIRQDASGLRVLVHSSITDGYYDPTSGVHHPYDVFIAQEQNIS